MDEKTDSTLANNPLQPGEPLKVPPEPVVSTEPGHAPQPILPGDSATTRAEKVERHGETVLNGTSEHVDAPSPKRRRIDGTNDTNGAETNFGFPKGTAAIKKEFLIERPSFREPKANQQHDDDAAEAAHHVEQGDDGGKKKKNRGQNKARQYGKWSEDVKLCATRTNSNEFSPGTCRFGDQCRLEHDLRAYLKQKREDLETFGKICPIWSIRGVCPAGWKCRFASSHSKEVEHPDGSKELVLVEDEERKAAADNQGVSSDEVGVVNVVSMEDKVNLNRKRYKTPRSDTYNDYLNKLSREETAGHKNGDNTHDNRAAYIEPPFLPSEKRRIYYGPETPVLAPLTTQGNMPFRRLCVSLGAQVTWSEMAMGLPLVQGEKSEWALTKAHTDELSPPKFLADSALGTQAIASGYEHSKDFRFGMQIAGNKPWIALKTTEVLTNLCPWLRAIDLNCGCPIDLVCRQGAGSALLDTPSKLEKIVRGMNSVSREIPITIKIRTGTRDKDPTADRLIERMTIGGREAREAGVGGPGTAAITLHGRSKQQRYTRLADWSYIAECSAVINRLRQKESDIVDTAVDVDPRNQPNGGRVYFLGNGDCYSHTDYNNHIRDAKVDSVMLGRGALIKPWVFEEIATGQYLDKSATERLGYVEQFAKYGLEAWGSDEVGVSTTRRFMLEWLSFSCRYVPIGLLEVLPPRINERPPPFKGRNDLETMMSSGNYKDWIKIRYVCHASCMHIHMLTLYSEMFLGPVPSEFKFQPKHKSNSYDNEVEG